MKTIFEEYENYLQNIVSNNGKYHYPEELVETRGTNYDVFKNIVDTMIVSLEYGVKHTINDKETIISDNIIIDNTFLDKPSLHIIWEKNSPTEAVVSLGEAYYNETDDKLHNVLITYYEGNQDYPNYDVLSLKKSLWHELQHTYRQYNVFKKEYASQKINTKEKNYKDLYTVRENNDTINKAIKAALYYSDINEINSHLNEMIPYLEEHKEINFTNYKNYLNSIPGYDVILKLKSLSSIYNDPNMYLNHNFIEKVGKIIYDKIFKNNSYYKNNKNLTPIVCVKRLRTRLNSSVLYALKQFYKILSYSLDKLQREGVYRWKNGNNYFNIFEEYEKILKS